MPSPHRRSPTTPEPVVLEVAAGVGSATHQLIAYLAARWQQPTPSEIWREGRRWLEARNVAVPNRQAFRAQALTRAAVYFDRFARPGWRFAGHHLVKSPGVEYDLVWQRGRRLEVDEIKTGRLRPADLERAQEQARLQLLAGDAAFGPGFAGVRVVVLTRPEQSFYLGR